MDRPAFNQSAFAASPRLMLVDIDQFNMRDSKSGLGEVAGIRMFATSAEGCSVVCHVSGFYPYFYCPVPEASVSAQRLKAKLDATLAAGGAQGSNPSGGRTDYIVSVEVVSKTSLLGFTGEGVQQFFKISVCHPKIMSQVKGILERGLPVLPGDRVWACDTVYETNVPFPLRFMIDLDLRGGCWFSINPASASLRSQNGHATYCQAEFDIPFSAIMSHAKNNGEREFNIIAPYRIMSFDIECLTDLGKGFPTPQTAAVIQIAAVCKTMNTGEHEQQSHVWTLNSCSEIQGTRVMSFDTEHELLSSFQNFLIKYDPDILTGYNIVNFDLTFLLERATHLGLKQFAQLGRTKDVFSVPKNSVFESRALGRRENKEIDIHGRIQFDMLTVIQREFKLRSYSLNAVSAHFLNEQKEDVHYSIMGDLQRGNADTRRRLAVYCVKDAVLPLRLMNKLLSLVNYTEMARVTGVPLTYLLTRGQMIKVASQIFRKAREQNYIVPTLSRGAPAPNAAQVGAGGDDDDGPASGAAFEGATVLEPITGFYQDPIATLDFASLYPSIMIAHNLCYSTLVSAKFDVSSPNSKVQESDITKTPCGNYFVKSNVRRGLLPMVLEELLSARKAARKAMGETTDSMLKMVLNGRQLALKISANSVYGFTGATVGMLPCLEISASVTAFGREMIEDTKRIVESTFKTGYTPPGSEMVLKRDAVVAYGDTDSVFVNFGVQSVADAMHLGNIAAQEISKTFIKPIKLEFEKVYSPFLLMNKKRYAGLYWTNPKAADKLDAKGIETVRRDNCELVKVVVEKVLNIILHDSSVDSAVKYVQGVISELLQNKVDLSMLVISKSLSKGADSSAYATKMAHVELAEKMRARDAASAPTVGDRVQYVMINASKGAKGYEKAEDPLYVVENNLSVDGYYYIEHQLKQPLMRIFENIISNAESVLFTGDHTRKVVNMALPSAGALGGFVVKALTCISCRSVIQGGAFCDYCASNSDKVRDVYLDKINSLRSVEVEFQRLWSQCQRCQGSIHQDVICTSRDCPIFYRRTKSRKDTAMVRDQVNRLTCDSQW